MAVLLFVSFTSCKRLDGETVVEGQIVDRKTGQPIPNALVKLFSGKNGSSIFGSAYNTIEFEKQADAEGKFAFRFEGAEDKSYVLRAFKEPGYYTAWTDAAYLKSGVNNKDLKLKMQAPAWVRVKLVNVPPIDKVFSLHIQSFSDMVNGSSSVTLYGLHEDTTFVRMVMGNVHNTFLVAIDSMGNSSADNLVRSNPSAYFPALDTTDLVLNY